MAEQALGIMDYGPGRDIAEQATRNQNRSRLILAWFGVSLVALLLVLAVFALIPLTEIKNLELITPSTIPTDELKALVKLPVGTNWFTVDLEETARDLQAHPRVKTAKVIKKFPDTLYLSIEERTPVAIVLARLTTGRLAAHCVDSAGTVFAALEDCVQGRKLPVLSGLEIRGLRYGMKLGDSFMPVLASLEKLGSEAPGLLAALSEVRIEARESAPPEAVVYLANYRLPVRARVELGAEYVKTMMLVLDVVERGGLASSIREIDLRSNTYVYRTKEAASE